MNGRPTTSPPSCSTSSTVAFAVPPVARTSSWITTRWPSTIASAWTSLEYGFDSLEVHADAIVAGQKVLIHDDVLATGGTAKATVELVEQLGGEVVGLPFIIELEFLNGRERLEGYDVYSLIKY